MLGRWLSTKSIKLAGSGSFPCMHMISVLFRIFHVCICVIFSHLSKKLWNFLYALASPSLICGHCLISLRCTVITPCGSPSNWCIICYAVSYPSFGGSCMQFLSIFFTSPVVYLISLVSFTHGSSIFILKASSRTAMK